MSDLTEKIIRQVEYYFGDVNLTKDKFLNEEIKKDDGWIPMDLLLKFNRLKMLSSDADVILTALKGSDSGLLEIDQENKKIRRAKPLPEDGYEVTVKKNSVYVKGFPTDLKLEDFYEFFGPFGKVLQVFMRRFPSTKAFKGSVFVTFETTDNVKSIMDKANELKYKDTPLIVELQEEYLKRKEGEKDEKNKKKEDKKNKIEEENKKILETIKRGAVLKITGLGGNATRESVKELFDNYASVDFIHYSRGEPEAIVRFKEENSAEEALKKALEANNNEIKLNEMKLECSVLKGEDENNYWTNEIKFKQNRRMESAKRKKKGGYNKKNNFKNSRSRRNDKNGEAGGDDDGDDDDGENGADNGNDNDDDDEKEESPSKKLKA